MALVTVDELKTALGVGDLYTEDLLQKYCDVAIELIEGLVTEASFTAEPAPMREAALATAVDVFQSTKAPGGTPAGADFTPAPFRMGRSLLSKVGGLLAPYMDAEGMLA